MNCEYYLMYMYINVCAFLVYSLLCKYIVTDRRGLRYYRYSAILVTVYPPNPITEEYVSS
jgi:hypothetical protein